MVVMFLKLPKSLAEWILANFALYRCTEHCWKVAGDCFLVIYHVVLDFGTTCIIAKT